jgi:hypothetical protein
MVRELGPKSLHKLWVEVLRPSSSDGLRMTNAFLFAQQSSRKRATRRLGRCGLRVAPVPPLRDPAREKSARKKKPGRSGRDDKRRTDERVARQKVSAVISGLWGVQSSGGKEMRQNLGAGFRNSTPTSDLPSAAAVM